MLFREIIAAYTENHMILKIYSGKNAELLNVKVCGTYSYHCALKSKRSFLTFCDVLNTHSGSCLAAVTLEDDCLVGCSLVEVH
jgi:hypothetical protein